MAPRQVTAVRRSKFCNWEGDIIVRMTNPVYNYYRSPYVFFSNYSEESILEKYMHTEHTARRF